MPFTNLAHTSTYSPIAYCIAATMLLTACTSEKSDNSITMDAGTVVVNLAHSDYDVYIGRGMEHHTHMMADKMQPGAEGWLGNPHPIGWCDCCCVYHSRAECIEAFRKDFLQKIEADVRFRECVLTLRGKRLGCYCKPEDCHGDIIKAWIDSHGQISGYQSLDGQPHEV